MSAFWNSKLRVVAEYVAVRIEVPAACKFRWGFKFTMSLLRVSLWPGPTLVSSESTYIDVVSKLPSRLSCSCASRNWYCDDVSGVLVTLFNLFIITILCDFVLAELFWRPVERVRFCDRSRQYRRHYCCQGLSKLPDCVIASRACAVLCLLHVSCSVSTAWSSLHWLACFCMSCHATRM